MRTLKIQFLFFLLILSSCASLNKGAKASDCSDDGKINFTFLQLNDVYEIAALEGGKVAGLARVETLHKELLKENPNTLMFMAGDFLNPSLLGTVEYMGQRIRGKQMIEVMNAMEFDLATFGNHEFDLSKNDLQKRLNEATFEFSSANVRQKVAGETYPFYSTREGIKKFVSDTHIFHLKDQDGTEVSLGFFSVTLPSNPQNYVAYTDIYEAAERAYNSLKGRVDLIFGLTHVKVSQDEKIAAMNPEIKLIMGGHEHKNMIKEVGSTRIAKADANAKTVYAHRLFYDRATGAIDIRSELVEINERIKADIEIKKLVDKWNGILKEKIKKVTANPEEIIFRPNTPLDGRDIPVRSTQTNLGTLITKAMAYGFENQVDCALVNGGSIRLDDWLDGAVNSIDIFRVLPFGGGIVKVKMKGSLLKEVLTYGESRAGTGAYLQRHLVMLDKDNQTWLIKGQAIKNDRLYEVVLSDYLMLGRDIPFLNPGNKGIEEVYLPKKDELGHDIRKTIIHYLKSLD